MVKFFRLGRSCKGVGEKVMLLAQPFFRLRNFGILEKDSDHF